MVIGACTAAALMLEVPDWARWTLLGLAIAVGASMGIIILVGPMARRLAGETAPLTAAERRQMTAPERVEAVNAARNTLIQAATGLVVVGGVVFTILGLRYTADSLETSRQAQLTADQGQITDRYTKAVEQLGSAKQDVRLGGIYALQRLAADSPRDRDTIRSVLAAYVRGHDLCTPPDRKSKLPKQCTARFDQALAKIPLTRPGADVLAALTIAPTLATARGHHSIVLRSAGRADFSEIRFPRTDLSHANLQDAYLPDADLRGGDLSDAHLEGVDLTKAHLEGVDLTGSLLGGADLGGADLRGADLGGADLGDVNLGGADLGGVNLIDAYLTGADLTDAYLTDAHLTGADLAGADLAGAYLTDAHLTGANLTGANLTAVELGFVDLTGANLRHVRGKTEKEIRAMAIVDAKTRF
ncbi:hypothetical protein B1L11_26100 [Microbispora sp. GKU 823]|nr:hypothetical protein B1L11_26100 [Microbispora sp. GKU 823]